LVAGLEVLYEFGTLEELGVEVIELFKAGCKVELHLIAFCKELIFLRNGLAQTVFLAVAIF
jgi:hypothetical protein